jgi:hypothetical protein
MRKFYLALITLGFIVCFYSAINKSCDLNSTRNLYAELVSDTTSFELKKGDILVRPNLGWLPGSCKIKGGRRYGHVAVVVEGATGSSIGETLGKAKVVEALFFDQATRKFEFEKEKQIREIEADVSFGERFRGNRYRLRLDLTDDQAEKMVRFLRNQIGGGYNIFSHKETPRTQFKQNSLVETKTHGKWNCSVLVWEAYYQATGFDIDANKGLVVYPSDLIASEYFNKPGDRIRF